MTWSQIASTDLQLYTHTRTRMPVILVGASTLTREPWSRMVCMRRSTSRKVVTMKRQWFVFCLNNYPLTCTWYMQDALQIKLPVLLAVLIYGVPTHSQTFSTILSIPAVVSKIIFPLYHKEPMAGCGPWSGAANF